MKQIYVQVYVRMRNIESAQEFQWTKDEFLNRLYVMKEMYQNYESGEEEWDLPAVCLKMHIKSLISNSNLFTDRKGTLF